MRQAAKQNKKRQDEQQRTVYPSRLNLPFRDMTEARKAVPWLKERNPNYDVGEPWDAGDYVKVTLVRKK